MLHTLLKTRRIFLFFSSFFSVASFRLSISAVYRMRFKLIHFSYRINYNCIIKITKSSFKLGSFCSLLNTSLSPAALMTNKCLLCKKFKSFGFWYLESKTSCNAIKKSKKCIIGTVNIYFIISCGADCLVLKNEVNFSICN